MPGGGAQRTQQSSGQWDLGSGDKDETGWRHQLGDLPTGWERDAGWIIPWPGAQKAPSSYKGRAEAASGGRCRGPGHCTGTEATNAQAVPQLSHSSPSSHERNVSYHQGSLAPHLGQTGLPPSDCQPQLLTAWLLCVYNF